MNQSHNGTLVSGPSPSITPRWMKSDLGFKILMIATSVVVVTIAAIAIFSI
jgi:hypothetical protein